jgi:DNA-binding GntR family transcriptional regulator
MAETPAQRITDEVYERLWHDIVTGALPSGARLSVPGIAERLHVSRTPARDAVQRLVQERLAHEEQRRGAVVAQLGLRELAKLYEVREVLEGLAARLAVENAGRRLVSALSEVMAEHEQAAEAEDFAQHMEIDMRFHALVRQAAGNPELVRLLDGIQAQVRLAMHTTSVSGGPRRALHDHQMILAAIQSGDPEAAESAARAHVSRLHAFLLGQAGAEAAAV